LKAAQSGAGTLQPFNTRITGMGENLICFSKTGTPDEFPRKDFLSIRRDTMNYDIAMFTNKTPEKYRNPWLAAAMVNLGMIDRLGYGIYTLCLSQMKRFFPLPDYDLSQPNKVILKIYGQSIDENYSKTLIQRGDLSLQEVILLDRIQKHLEITDHAAVELRKKKLIEGRKPNYFIGAKISQTTGQKAAYTKNKGLNKQYYLDLILESIKQHRFLTRKDIDELLWEKLPDIYNDKQKKIKVTNLIAELRHKGKITNKGTFAFPKWTLL
jgi:ATP-dependent DNA helicase RecG